MPGLLRSKFPGRVRRTEVAYLGDLDHSTHGPAGRALPAVSLLALLTGAALAAGKLVGLRRFVVEGPSMVPTLLEGERLLARRVRRLRRGDLVVFLTPGERDLVSVKRIARVGRGEVTVLGDNAGASIDSRAFGPLPLDQVLGVAIYRYAPTPRRLPRGPR